MIRNWSACFFFLFSSTTAYAQASDQCRDLLLHGLYDQSREFTQSQASSSIDKQLCDAYNRYTQDTIAGGAQASYGLFGGSLSLSKASIEAVGKVMCSHDSSASASAGLVEKASSLLNAAAIEAWRACVTAREQRGLLSTWRFREEDQRFVSLEVEYVPPPGAATEIKVNRIIIQPQTGLSCVGELAQLEGRTIKPSLKYSMACTRSVSEKAKPYGSLGPVWAEPATIQVNTAAGQLRADWRAIRPAAPRPVATVPVGTILAYMGKSTKPSDIPPGWLLCNGGEYSKSMYPELLAVLGESYGKPTTADTFKVPNLAGMFLRGFDPSGSVDKGTASRVGPEGQPGNFVGSVELGSTALPANSFSTTTDGNHSHGMNFESTAGRSDGKVRNTIASPACCGSARPATDDAGAHSHKINGGGDPETRPVNTAVLYLIKAVREQDGVAAGN
jgi:microcystin-dependent protein